MRAFVHRLDDRSDRLRTLGAEVVDGDLRDFRSVAAAMGGIRRAYLPIRCRRAWSSRRDVRRRGTLGRCRASRKPVAVVAGRRRAAHPDQARHWLVEQIFDWAGVGAVHLDATVFYENLRTWAMLSLARAGVIALPWGREATAIPMVGAEDVARVAAAVLTGPALSSGTVVRLMAGAVTNREIAKAFSDILRRPVGYVEVNDDQWARRRFGSRGQRCCGGTPHPLVALLAHSPARRSSLISHHRRVRTLHQPATAVAAAIPAKAQRPVRRGDATMMLGSYVVVCGFACARAQLKGRGSRTAMALKTFCDREVSRRVDADVDKKRKLARAFALTSVLRSGAAGNRTRCSTRDFVI